MNTDNYMDKCPFCDAPMLDIKVYDDEGDESIEVAVQCSKCNFYEYL